MKCLGLIVLQWFVVLVYAKNGYKCTDPNIAYQWAVFFNVSNQLIITAWIYLLCEGRWRNLALMFSGGLAVIWCNWYIAPLKLIVTTYGLFEPILSYMVICLIITFVINYHNKK